MTDTCLRCKGDFGENGECCDQLTDRQAMELRVSRTGQPEPWFDDLQRQGARGR